MIPINSSASISPEPSSSYLACDRWTVLDDSGFSGECQWTLTGQECARVHGERCQSNSMTYKNGSQVLVEVIAAS